jgi:hypothetical protein
MKSAHAAIALIDYRVLVHIFIDYLFSHIFSHIHSIDRDL